MLRRWEDLPRGIRWLVGIAIVVLALALVWALFVPVADWVAHHDVGSTVGALHETALDNARGRLLTLGAGLAALVALVFTARTFWLSREGQVTDRYTKAIEQLGSDKLDVRIGGIYALERIARDSARDHPTVMAVLTAFIREHSSEQWPPPDPDGREEERSTRPDVQAAVTVVGRRDAKRDVRRIDITDARLITALRMGQPLRGLDLTGANLTRANLAYARFADVDFTRACLVGADLFLAKLTNAKLAGADLTGANLSGTDLSANLDGADLTGANLVNADLTHAFLTATKLINADLHSADLDGAFLTDADLTGANLTGARWPVLAPVPEGWELDAGSRRFPEADAGAEPADAN